MKKLLNNILEKIKSGLSLNLKVTQNKPVQFNKQRKESKLVENLEEPVLRREKQFLSIVKKKKT